MNDVAVYNLFILQETLRLAEAGEDQYFAGQKLLLLPIPA
jgi:hypothetical protein